MDLNNQTNHSSWPYSGLNEARMGTISGAKPHLQSGTAICLTVTTLEGLTDNRIK